LKSQLLDSTIPGFWKGQFADWPSLVDRRAGKLAGEDALGAGFPEFAGDVLAGAQMPYRQTGAKN
jgi:hypothetical protein